MIVISMLILGDRTIKLLMESSGIFLLCSFVFVTLKSKTSFFSEFLKI